MGGAPAASRLTGNYDSPAPHPSLSIQIQVTFLVTEGEILTWLQNAGHFPLNHPEWSRNGTPNHTRHNHSKRMFDLQNIRLEEGQLSCPKNAKACPCYKGDEI